MKKEFKSRPACFDGKEMYGFDWKEHVLTIPSPLAVVTSYKAGGRTNATMQSWMTFANSDGFYCIFGDVNINGHMYKTIKETKACVINFPSAEVYGRCYSTISHNGDDEDEISAAGLTAEDGSIVKAPRIAECFLNLECEYAWERELSPGSRHTVLCVRVVNVVMDEEHYDAGRKGRYGDSGYLYNIHSPVNPETGEEEQTFVAAISKLAVYDEL